MNLKAGVFFFLLLTSFPGAFAGYTTTYRFKCVSADGEKNLGVIKGEVSDSTALGASHGYIELFGFASQTLTTGRMPAVLTSYSYNDLSSDLKVRAQTQSGDIKITITRFSGSIGLPDGNEIDLDCR